MAITLDHDKHDIVKKQLQRLEWCGTEGGHCPECGGVRPKDKRRPRLDGRGQPMFDRNGGALTDPICDDQGNPISGIMNPDPHEGHGRTCSLAASIAIMSSKDRIVVYCAGGTPAGYEAGK